jgi:spoIIIJ-associated protein
MDSLVEPVLKELLALMGVTFSGISREIIAGQTVFSIETTDAPTLIGAHGDTIYALDTLVKKIVENKVSAASVGEVPGPREPLFLIDVGGYRAQKIKDLQQKALVMAERAKSLQYDVELEPMTAYERLIVHTTLQDAPNVKTESQGEGRSRRVVIKYSA